MASINAVTACKGGKGIPEIRGRRKERNSSSEGRGETYDGKESSKENTRKRPGKGILKEEESTEWTPVVKEK